MRLVAANARLARFASITAALAAVGAVLLLRATGPEWTLRVAALLYASAGVVALMIHLLHHVRAEVDELQFTESTDTVDRGQLDRDDGHPRRGRLLHLHDRLLAPP